MQFWHNTLTNESNSGGTQYTIYDIFNILMGLKSNECPIITQTDNTHTFFGGSTDSSSSFSFPLTFLGLGSLILKMSFSF
jgi:hypothetical protein